MRKAIVGTRSKCSVRDDDDPPHDPQGDSPDETENDSTGGQKGDPPDESERNRRIRDFIERLLRILQDIHDMPYTDEDLAELLGGNHPLLQVPTRLLRRRQRRSRSAQTV
jgi:hypothetical protein